MKKTFINIYLINFPRILFKNILENKIVSLIVLFYIVLMTSIIQWGIPNTNHPFNYHMDEWHQLQSIRTLFTKGSSNVPGAAHGPVFHFFLSGIYLGFFTILGIINPSEIKSSITEIAMQEKLFIVLRSNSLLFGVFSLVCLAIIAKKFFKMSPVLPVLLFFLTPIWLALSNYFKYDIALTFWILVSFIFLLKYGIYPNKKNYLLAGFFCSLAVATKISALPMLIIYIMAFFYFNFKKKKNYFHLILGILLFIFIFSVFGVPDILMQKGDYSEFFYSVLIADPNQTPNFIINYNHWLPYVLFRVFPLNFGYAFFILHLVTFLYIIKLLLSSSIKKNYIRYKNEFFVFLSLLIFLLSLAPLKIGANGNRLLVLLPLFSLLTSVFLRKMWIGLRNNNKIFFITFMTLAIVLQAFQAIALVSTKWEQDVRERSSSWVTKNVRSGEIIGIENIPIYQMLPDIVVKEFYTKQYNPKSLIRFNYEIVNYASVSLPNTVIITNQKFATFYQKNSPKKLLVARLKKENYKLIAEYRPSPTLYSIFGNELDMIVSGLVPIPTISIYIKK